MLETPWGDADALRHRRPPPDHGSNRQRTRRDQRERLFAATVASSAEKGFAATSVEDLLRISGVSRNTFYEQFDDKLDCFRAAEATIVAGGIAATAARLESHGDPLGRARATLETFVELIVRQPAAARMCLLDAYSTEEPGVAEPLRAAIERIIDLGGQALDQAPGRGPMPPDLVRGIVGGFYKVIYNRLRAHREEELPELVPVLWDWAMSYPPPVRVLRRPGRLGVVETGSALPPFASHSTEQRIVRAFATAVAAKGYTGATIADVAARASISRTTFYRYFDGKDDVLAAALDSSGTQMLAAALPPVRRVSDWRTAVRIGFEEICGFLAAEPDFARLRMVEVYSAGPEAIAIRDRAGAEFVGTLLSPAIAGTPAIHPVVVEAVAGAIYGILFACVYDGRTVDMPRLSPVLTYLALSPFLGAEEASAVATATGRSAPAAG